MKGVILTREGYVMTGDDIEVGEEDACIDALWKNRAINERRKLEKARQVTHVIK